MSKRRTKRQRPTHEIIDEKIIQFQTYYGKNIAERKQNIKLIAKTINQSDYIKMLSNPYNTIVFATGPAGSGKTMLACLAALKAFNDKKVNKIILTRPAVEVDEQHGFLPGTLEEKMEPWVKPIFDIFQEYYSKTYLNYLVEQGTIEISPLAYMRGRNFKNSFIILDEAQGCTINQLKMALTRISEGSRMVITGDLQQIDKKQNNGLIDFLSRLKNKNDLNYISHIEFDMSDIQRHPAVAEVLNIYS